MMHLAGMFHTWSCRTSFRCILQHIWGLPQAGGGIMGPSRGLSFLCSLKSPSILQEGAAVAATIAHGCSNLFHAPTTGAHCCRSWAAAVSMCLELGAQGLPEWLFLSRMLMQPGLGSSSCFSLLRSNQAQYLNSPAVKLHCGRKRCKDPLVPQCYLPQKSCPASSQLGCHRM